MQMERLVGPGHLTPSQFWVNYFAHVHWIKAKKSAEAWVRTRATDRHSRGARSLASHELSVTDYQSTYLQKLASGDGLSAEDRRQLARVFRSVLSRGMRLTLHRKDLAPRAVRLKARDSSLVLEGDEGNDGGEIQVPLSDIETLATSDESENRFSLTAAHSGTLLLAAATPMEMYATMEGLEVLREFPAT